MRKVCRDERAVSLEEDATVSAELKITRDTGPDRSPDETIVAAALCYDGNIYSMPPPTRHYQIMHAMLENDVPDDATHLRYQGFVTNTGRFVDRYEAARIARAANQLIREPTPKDMLTSEDVW